MQDLQYSRISIFKELTCGTFEWYRIASDEERTNTGQYIVVDDILSEDELWQRLEAD